MKVLLLTPEQKDMLVGQYWDVDSRFSPSQDYAGHWYVSIQERDGLTNEDFAWIRGLSEIDFTPHPPSM